jgi:hypothetical protein
LRKKQTNRKETIMWGDLIKTGGYALVLKEAVGLVTKSRQERMNELQRSKNLNIALGMTVGTALGITTGILLAPRSGREIRSHIADWAEDKVHRTQETLERSPRFRSAAQSADEAGKVVKEAAERAL